MITEDRVPGGSAVVGAAGDVFADDVGGAAHAVGVDTAQVFAQDADADQLGRGEDRHQGGDGGEAGHRRVAVEVLPDQADGQQQAADADQEAQVGDQAQGLGRVAQDHV